MTPLLYRMAYIPFNMLQGRGESEKVQSAIE